MENKTNLKDYKKYYTHNNGGRPYIVYIKNEVLVYSNSSGEIQFEKHYKPLKIFIGKSPKTEITTLSKGFGKKFDGNSILLKISVNKYVFIGHIILEFNVKNDNIVSFISPIGNNDVPYPIAIGKKYVYGFAYPFGYFKKEDIDTNLDYIDIFNKMTIYEPFAKSFRNGKSDSKISLKKFRSIMNKSVKDISLSILKTFCRIFKVTSDGTKDELISRLENLRDIKFIK